ncbi:response regulator [Haloarcula nitratireducens]|uniref:Response regulator n=1 Tax=Haloarcula nitratireducens TaxID=2487749 RepID=A0AAW4PD30_9EURY|nr:response regulator [Halomicroarcula nitratireducens]MBX0295816.1 response regulator [Halomicroarcula nitratireducens]
MGMVHSDTNGERDGTIEREGRCRVLLVDDEPTVAALVSEYLEHVDEGLEVTYTTAPTEALDRVDEFDCVVTDYQLPRLDGITLVERADGDAGFVLYTAVRDHEVAVSADEVGAAYMRKRTDTDQYAALAALIRAQAL